MTGCLAECETENGGSLLYLFFCADQGQSKVGSVKTSRVRDHNDVATVLSHLLSRYHRDICFGPCLNGSVFEFRTSDVPCCNVSGGMLHVELGDKAGHFHLRVAPTEQKEQGAAPHIVRAAAFVGSNCPPGSEQQLAFGFRFWNEAGQQCFNVFFDTEGAWKAALSDVVAGTNKPFSDSKAPFVGRRTAWSDDRAEARILFYLRLLYSDLFERRIALFEFALPTETRKILRMLPDGIGLERVSRLKNLMQSVAKNTRLLSLVMDKENLFHSLRSWVDSPYFWEPKGRTLIEAFCLYLYPLIKQRSPVHAELVRLEGVAAAAPLAMQAPSPWNRLNLSLKHQLLLGGQSWTESFVSEFEVFDEAGEISVANLLSPNQTPQSISVSWNGESLNLSAGK